MVFFCFQMEDVFWGWNNEVHIFDPMQASWSEPKTHVSQLKSDSSFYTLNTKHLTSYLRDKWKFSSFWKSVKTISKILRWFFSDRFCVQGRAPAPRAAHAGATLGCRGYICGGRVMVRALLAFQIFLYIRLIQKIKVQKPKSKSSIFNFLFLNTGNQDKWHSLSGPWIMDVVRNVRHSLKIWRNYSVSANYTQQTRWLGQHSNKCIKYIAFLNTKLQVCPNNLNGKWTAFIYCFSSLIDNSKCFITQARIQLFMRTLIHRRQRLPNKAPPAHQER